jgi:hypothetical protein
MDNYNYKNTQNYKDTENYKAYERTFGADKNAKPEPIPTSFDEAMMQTGLGATDAYGMPVLPAPNVNTSASNLPAQSTTGYNYKKLLVPALYVLAAYLIFKKK